MAFDEGLAERIRDVLRDRRDVVEKRMFGGLAFIVRGHMTLGVRDEDLMLRVGPDAHEDALGRPHARPMDFTGRALKGFVYVGPAGLEADGDLRDWIGLGLAFAESQPPK